MINDTKLLQSYLAMAVNNHKPKEFLFVIVMFRIYLKIRPMVRPRFISGFSKSPAPARRPRLCAASAVALPSVCGGPQNHFGDKPPSAVLFFGAAPRLFSDLCHTTRHSTRSTSRATTRTMHRDIANVANNDIISICNKPPAAYLGVVQSKIASMLHPPCRLPGVCGVA